VSQTVLRRAAAASATRLVKRIVLPLALFTTVIGVTTVVAPGAALAASASKFYVSYGNTVTSGTVTWYNLSNTFSGSLHAVSGSRKVCFEAWNYSGKVDSKCSAPVSASNTGSFTVTIDGSGAGGWYWSNVWLRDAASNTDLGTMGDLCTRGEDYCKTAVMIH
jgi:hypothetical protein